MGYGTALTPALLLAGLSPLKIVPAVMVSQLAGDIVVSIFHHRLGNANFKLGSVELHVALILGCSGILAPLVASLVALRLSGMVIKYYVAAMTTIIGLFLLSNKRIRGRLSRGKALLLSLIAGFNKGLTGGGYGPLIAGGQVILGAEARSAVAITALAEGLTCTVATVVYYLSGTIDVSIAGPMTLGTILSAPLAAMTIKRSGSVRIRKLMGLAALGLGLACLIC